MEYVKHTLCFTYLIVISYSSLYAQNNFPLTVTTDQNLNYGTVFFNSGMSRIGINDPNKVTVSITGVRSFDVLVEITADQELLLNGNPTFAGVPSKSIAYTLEAAYQNQGLPASEVGAATLFTVTNNMATEIFQIDETKSGPKNPPAGNPNLPEGTAYVYIYGSINVGAVSSGTYNGNITVSVTYN